MNPLALASLATCVLTTLAHAQSGTVRYDVDLTRSREQLIRVRMTLSGVTSDAVDIHLPVWRPGLYMVLDPAGSVRTIAASAESSTSTAALPIEKIQKSSWRITTQGHTAVTVEYDLWAASLDNRTRHADDTHAFMNPSTVFMYAHEWRALPIEIALALPEVAPGATPWSVACGLEHERQGQGWTLTAPNYDALADAPIEAGAQLVIPFTESGAAHEIVIWTGEPDVSRSITRGQATKWDNLADDFAKIVRTQREIFGSLPYQRYTFLIHCYPGGRGGTEHYNSTIMQTPPEALRDDERYRSFLGLVAHEFFHTWNVKRFRPAGLTPYDYQRENLTDLLWVAEGATTYYEGVTLARAGLRTKGKFLDQLGDDIHSTRTRLGAKVQSVADSSYDAWVKFNKRTADSANSGVSFYDKGSMVCFALDMEIRKRKPGASLDTVMKRLFEMFPEPTKGFTEADLRAVIGEASGDSAWVQDFFARYVRGVEPIDFESALAVVGYELRPGASKPTPYLGVTVTEESGLGKVATVATDSPALQGPGLVPGDLIVAIDGRKVRPAEWEKEIGKRAPGEVVTLTFFRHEAMREIKVTLADKPEPKATIRVMAERTPEQIAEAARWIGASGE